MTRTMATAAAAASRTWLQPAPVALNVVKVNPHNTNATFQA
jgi:hypothetical protein